MSYKGKTNWENEENYGENPLNEEIQGNKFQILEGENQERNLWNIHEENLAENSGRS